MASKAEQRKLAKLRAQRNQLRNEPRTPKGNYTKANREAKADVDNEVAGLMGEMRRKKDKRAQQAQNKAARQAAKQARQEVKQNRQNQKNAAAAYGQSIKDFQTAVGNFNTARRNYVPNADDVADDDIENFAPERGAVLRARDAMDKAKDAMDKAGGDGKFGVGKKGGRYQAFSTGNKGYIDSKGRVH